MNTHHLLTTRGPAGCIRPFIWLLLWLSTTGPLRAQGFPQQTGAANPFNNTVGSNNGLGTSPTLADLDGDGDLDLLNVDKNGNLFYYRNTGTKTTPSYTSAPSPIGLPSEGVNGYLNFQFGDLDGDGDLDAVTGNSDGVILSYRNTGSKTNPVFVQLTGASNFLAGYDFGDYSTVSLADFDGDGDLDLLSITDQLHYLRNTGSATTPVYTDVTGAGNPFAGIVQARGLDTPSVGDVDGDGDLDLAVSRNNTIDYYQNTGSKTNPVYAQLTGAANPFNGFSVSIYPAINFGDVDGDGDSDAVVGYYGAKNQNQPLIYLKNVLHLPQQPTPASQTVCVGGSVNTTVLATGDGPITYQWYRDAQNTNTPVAGQTSATLTLTNVQAGDAGLYYARATGGVGSLFSTAFTLTVPGAGITQQPVSGSSVCVGTTVTAFVSTTGTVSSYQWYRNGSVVSGQTSATLTLPNTTTASAGSYSVVVTGSCNSVTSTAFSLTVTPQSPDYQPLADLYASTNGPGWTRSNNWLTGCTPCGWAGVTCNSSGRVSQLDLGINKLAGTLPASLSTLTSLNYLDLRQNQLTGFIPATLSALTGLAYLDLSDNAMTGGNILTNLSTLTVLRYLDLSGNTLTGGIPASLSALVNLQALRLGASKLTGTIPASLSALTKLTELGLTDNQLTGSIPTSLSALTNLQTLNLSINQLSGSIPASLSALTNLRYLYLLRNKLSGSIPAGLSALTNIIALYVDQNELTGCFPASLSALCSKNVDFSNNPSLPGGGDFAAFCRSGAGSDAFQPLATASPNPVCAGNPVSLSVTTGTFYQWSGPASFTATTQTPTFIPATAASSGLYSVTVGNGSTTCTATASVSLTVNALPVVSITPSATAICAGQSATFSATPDLATYRWTTPNNGPILTTASISVSVAGTYSLTVTNASGCSATAQASLTVNPLPTPAIQGLVSSICQEAASVPLTGSPTGGVFTIDGSTATTLNPAKLTVGQHTVVYSVTNSNGCSNTTSQTVTVKPTPQTPTIATQSGHAYPAGLSSLTISQNTGNVILTASGCPGGTITWSGGNNTTLAVSTMNTGVQTFTATCQTNGCTSPIATATVTVVPTTLSVLHRDGNGQTNTNTLAPYLQLNNQGNTAIPYQEITVRYWLTVENYSPLLFAINYAQLGSDKVHLKYVPASTGNPNATGYIEFSFDAAAGSLGAGQNSGPIQDLINKQDYAYFNQADDYSYVNTGTFTPNQRITAYRNGPNGTPTLFWGQEPGVVVPTRSLKASSQNNTAPDANTIEAVLSVTNDGSLPVNYSDLKLRYYFTQDNTQPLVLSQVGYAALGSGNVTAQVVSINPALSGADTYLELSFAAGLGQLAPGAGTGGVTYQLRHGDYSGFNQANDYSYQGTGGMMLNPRVVVFVAGQRVWGIEPGASGRVAAAGPEVPLRVRVLGNPVTGSTIDLEVRGAEGQPLQLHLSDQQGRSVSERRVETAGSVEHQTIAVGQQPAGLLLLRVSTPSQSQTVKVLKIE